MFSDICLFSLSLLITGILIFILIYFFITLSDLECDYINATECCGKLNFWNVPKLWLQLIVNLMLLLMGHFWLFVFHLPISIFLARRFFTKISKGSSGEYDPGEVYNHGQLKRHVYGIAAHFGWQMFGFFIFLYCLLDAVMNEPVVMEQDDVEMLNKPHAAEELYEPKHYDTGSDL